MRVSSRTPEGEGNTCQVCGKPFVLEPSLPAADAPCPHCGSLAWFEPSAADELPERDWEPQRFARDFSSREQNPAGLPVFRCVEQAIVVPYHDKAEITAAERRRFEFGRCFSSEVRNWSHRRRRRDRDTLAKIMCEVTKCESRSDLEAILGPPRYSLGGRDEYYKLAAGLIVLRFKPVYVSSIYGMIAFSPAELGAGLAPASKWLLLEPEFISRSSPETVRAFIRQV